MSKERGHKPYPENIRLVMSQKLRQAMEMYIRQSENSRTDQRNIQRFKAAFEKQLQDTKSAEAQANEMALSTALERALTETITFPSIEGINRANHPESVTNKGFNVQLLQTFSLILTKSNILDGFLRNLEARGMQDLTDWTVESLYSHAILIALQKYGDDVNGQLNKAPVVSQVNFHRVDK